MDDFGILPLLEGKENLPELTKETVEQLVSAYNICNGEIKDDTSIGKLMQDLSCTNPDDMNYKELADRARYFKRDKEGQQAMCKIVEEIVSKEVHDARIEMAEEMIQGQESMIPMQNT